MRPWRVEVVGHSMEPVLRSGDWVLVLPPRRPPRVGDVVLLRDPRAPSELLLKRVHEVGPDGCTVLGDRSEDSLDSRTFGRVPLDSVVGRVAFRYAPLRRIGPVRGG